MATATAVSRGGGGRPDAGVGGLGLGFREIFRCSDTHGCCDATSSPNLLSTCSIVPLRRLLKPWPLLTFLLWRQHHWREKLNDGEANAATLCPGFKNQLRAGPSRAVWAVNVASVSRSADRYLATVGRAMASHFRQCGRRSQEILHAGSPPCLGVQSGLGNAAPEEGRKEASMIEQCGFRSLCPPCSRLAKVLGKAWHVLEMTEILLNLLLVSAHSRPDGWVIPDARIIPARHFRFPTDVHVCQPGCKQVQTVGQLRAETNRSSRSTRRTSTAFNP